MDVRNAHPDNPVMSLFLPAICPTVTKAARPHHSLADEIRGGGTA